MRERPILFTGPMVRAILAGNKTQTRRVAKEFAGRDDLDSILARFPNQNGCPYGQPGDRLWVREKWSSDFAHHYPYDRVWYAADDDRRHDIEVRNGVRGIYSPESQEFVPFRWRPSIHMPRSACRLVLEVTGVRVERLNNISQEDAELEGVECNMSPLSFREHFQRLWEHINGAGSWDANPWVWVVEFRRIEDGIAHA
ncbi:hypothetical protein [Achromobacter xylosoxidans]|uniref:hypothetical protein n=1 Tax=Alcaligenes xylosoxydans xylosoxydans TaxID=85698 RepID=UPI00047B908E|nr:hypothetical protein [Achromobacter xylosoxidans]